MKSVKNKPADQKTYLKNLLSQFVKLQAASKSKIQKYEELLKRESAKNWNKKKTDRSTQRLEQARLEYEQSFVIIDQIKTQLGQLQ